MIYIMLDQKNVKLFPGLSSTPLAEGIAGQACTIGVGKGVFPGNWPKGEGKAKHPARRYAMLKKIFSVSLVIMVAVCFLLGGTA